MVGNILAVGLMSLGMGISGVKDEPQMYAQDESTYTITYNAEDWQEKAPEVKDWLVEETYNSTENMLTITGSVSNYDTLTLQTIYYNSTADQITFVTTGATIKYEVTNETWLYGSTSFVLGTLQITSQTYYEGNQEPPNMGQSIIVSIASGLGLIGALATEFLAGFGALLYDSGALTPFAIFSLVMLGVAVSFAIVKLVLALIRSNTGA